MRSYQFFKICERFDQERKKMLLQQLMGKKKLKKVGLCFIKGCFIKSFNMITRKAIGFKSLRLKYWETN